MGDTSMVSEETTPVMTMRATTENGSAGSTSAKIEEWYQTKTFIGSVIGGTLVLIAIIIVLVAVYLMRKKKNGNEKDGNDTSSITPDIQHMSEDGTGRRLSNYPNYGYVSDEDDNNSGNWTGMSPNRLPRHPWETQIPDTIHPHSQKDRGHLQGLHGDNSHHSQPRDIFYTSPNERFENDRNRNFGYNKQPLRSSQGEEHFHGRDQNSPPLSSSPRPDFSHHNYMGEVVPQKRFSYLEEGSPMPSPHTHRRSVLERTPSKRDQSYGISPPKRSSYGHDPTLHQSPPRQEFGYDMPPQKRGHHPADHQPPMNYIPEEEAREHGGQSHAGRLPLAKKETMYPESPDYPSYAYDDDVSHAARMPHSKRGSSYLDPPHVRGHGSAFGSGNDHASPDRHMFLDQPHDLREPSRERYSSNKRASHIGDSSNPRQVQDRYPSNKRASHFDDSSHPGQVQDRYPGNKQASHFDDSSHPGQVQDRYPGNKRASHFDDSSRPGQVQDRYPGNKRASHFDDSSHPGQVQDRYPGNKRASAYGDPSHPGYHDEYHSGRDLYNGGAPSNQELDSNWQFGPNMNGHWSSGKVLY